MDNEWFHWQIREDKLDGCIKKAFVTGASYKTTHKNSDHAVEVTLYTFNGSIVYCLGSNWENVQSNNRNHPEVERIRRELGIPLQ